MKTSLSVIAALALVPAVNAFGTSQQPMNADSISRRDSFAGLASIVGGVAGITALPNMAGAMPDDETPRIISRMGGLLVSSSIVSLNSS